LEDEAIVKLPLIRDPLRAIFPLLLLRINPEKPWKAILLLETPIGGVCERELVATYLL
jgi:hypothetical protein